MDETTRRYYDDLDDAQAARYESVGGGISEFFPLAFPPRTRVLDLGSGTGRDAALLAAGDRQVYGIEPSSRMREIALRHHPELAGQVFAGELPENLPSIHDLGGRFDGVVCCAVLQHLPRHELFDAVFAIRGLLVERGRLLVSIPDDAILAAQGDRDEHDRLFNRISAGELDLLFERGGFHNIGRWTTDDALGRPDRRWVTLLYELRSTP